MLSIFYLLNGAVAVAEADKVVNGSLFALPVDRGVNNNYFNNSLAAIYRMLNETAAAIQWFVLRYPLLCRATLFKMYVRQWTCLLKLQLNTN